MQHNIKNQILRYSDLNLIAVVSISTLLLALGRYHPLNIDFRQATELIYYLLVPLTAGLLLFRDKPWDYGIRIGRWKSSILPTLACLAAVTLILFGVGKMPEFRAYYHLDAMDWSELLLDGALYYFAWEFLFCGYVLFGLEKSMGRNAIFVQTIPFVLLHFGRPFLETVACIPGGFIFGYVAYRTRSFLPCFIIHFGIYAMIIFLPIASALRSSQAVPRMGGKRAPP